MVRSLVDQIVASATDAGSRIWSIGDAENILLDIGDFVIFSAAALLVIMLLWVGISYLMAGSDESKVIAAKIRLKYTLIGAALIMGVSVIIRTIGMILATGSIV